MVLVAPAEHLIGDFEAAFPGVKVRSHVITNGVPKVTVERKERPCGVLYYARGGGSSGDDMFFAVARRCPEIKFEVIGRDIGTFENIVSHGWVQDPFSVMARSRVLLNASPTEGMPNTVLQALAMGLRVVGPPNEGILELAERYPEHFALYDLASPDEAAERLRSTYASVLLGPAQVPSDEEVRESWRALMEGSQL